MKPNFALTLSFDGIGLLHRAFPGWHLVGDVALDHADLATELSSLRDKALALDPIGLNCKLVLPDEQIKYLRLDLPDTDVEEAVRTALDGATPYAVDDLAFDYRVDTAKLFVAAVARETLAEAETFAMDHGFNPISFVGQPSDDDFSGEPFFGATRNFLSQGYTETDIARDMAAVRVLGSGGQPQTPQADTTPEPMAPSESGSNLDAPAQAAIDAVPEAAGPAAPDDDAPEAVAGTFSSIRATRADDNAAPPRLDGVIRDAAAPRIKLGTVAEDDVPSSAPVVTGVSDAALPEDALPASQIRPTPSDRLEAQATSPAPVTVDDFDPASVTEPAPDLQATQKSVMPSFFTRRSRTKPVLAGGGPAPEDERQRMTIFGAREKTVVGGKPRFLGLILTAVLLLFLIGVAAWASIFVDNGLARFFRGDPTPVVADIPVEKPAPPAEDKGVDVASLQPQEPQSVLDDPATEILSRVSPQDLSPDEAKARYAATGIWQLAPEPPRPVEATVFEDVYQVTLDPPLDLQDAVALPAVAASFSDGIFFSPPLPPAANTRFVLDERGFVLATDEGALTPDGVLVFAGQPPVLPPVAVSRGAPPATATAENAAAESRLAALRPRSRPADIEEQIERRDLSGRTRNELAALRPVLRPASVQEIAEAERLAAAEAEETARAAANPAAAASTVDLAALEGAVAEAVSQPDPFANATAQAVKASLKPKLPPNNFDRIVQRTKRNQERAETEEAQPVRVASTQRVTPKIPTAASVSKAATERNALKFKRVNLIGVYGTPNNRRALVRMSNGRYKKVKVGDRLDGGKVSAIGDGDLRYQKGGRSITLKMPRG